MVEIPSQNRTNLRASSIKRRQHISKRIAQTFLKETTDCCLERRRIAALNESTFVFMWE